MAEAGHAKNGASFVRGYLLSRYQSGQWPAEGFSEKR